MKKSWTELLLLVLLILLSDFSYFFVFFFATNAITRQWFLCKFHVLFFEKMKLISDLTLTRFYCHVMYVQHVLSVFNETCLKMWSQARTARFRWHIKNLLFCRFSLTHSLSICNFFVYISLIIYSTFIIYLFIFLCIFIQLLNFILLKKNTSKFTLAIAHKNTKKNLLNNTIEGQRS